MKKIYIYIHVMFALVCSACSDWLTVTPSTALVAENMYTTKEGVTNALNGLYLLMRGHVYQPSGYMGGESLAELLAASWSTTPGSLKYSIATHDYSVTAVENQLNNTFEALYKIVNNANPLVEGLDKNKNLLDETTYNMVKGEALAIRAYVLFDLIRMWGPVPSKVDASRRYLPYPTKNSTENYPYVSYEEFMRRLKIDMDAAEELLKKSDPLLSYSVNQLEQTSAVYNGDWLKRTGHINYYGVLALKARVNLWLGEKEEALRYAKLVKDAKNEDGTTKFRLADETLDFAKWTDGTFYAEHICGVNVEQFDYMTSGWAQGNNVSTFQWSSTFLKDLFNGNAKDLRFVKQWTVESSTMYPPTMTLRVLRKYRGFYSSSSSPRNMPLIRLAEMYFIIMECGSLTECNEAYEAFCTSRKVPYTPFASETQRDDAMLMEYIREFIGEGQNFFTYKRYCTENMLWGYEPCTEEQYVVKLPTRDIFN